MQVVSTRDFRANQKKYFEIAEKEPVFVVRRGARPISISVVNDDDFMATHELQSIARGIEDIKNGRVHRMGDNETLGAMLDRLGYGV